ncbi:hypothetical protein GCM10008014_18210 [Paenibacillus silvae]|uniref:GerMN domain-containing protein n=1 Tax=Paenibacillus silvae TaxID=1325358 RepID=A0ABQ1Z6D2_9BACL|nr:MULTISPECIES: GerMN domain-containing protein [Paenibacillus]GGH51978.1 hypothetical protein GCM10008014_18210 [Paenibacillus silvae]
MRKKSSYTLVFSLISLMLVLAGCGDKPAVDPGNKQSEAANPSTSNASSPTNTPDNEPTKQEIEVGYVDAELTEVKTKKEEITFSDSSEKYRQAFDVMQRSDDPAFISLWSDIGLESMDFQDGQLTLDIHIPDEARLGAGGELLFLAVLQQTMFQFEEVRSIQLLVDGQETESLMGHAELPNPILRESE